MIRIRNNFGDAGVGETFVLSGFYGWCYTECIPQKIAPSKYRYNCFVKSYDGMRSNNFYPGCFSTEWIICFKEDDNRSNSNDYEKQIKVLFNGTYVVEVPVSFMFTILGRRYTLALSEKGSRSYEIASFSDNELRSKDYRDKIEVKWSMDNIANTEDLPAVLMQDLASLLDSGKFSDVEIETEDGSRIPVHRNILSARSSAFCAMLENDMLENITGCIKIDDFPAPTVKDMVKYMYTGRLPEFNCECATELLKAADKYDLKDLKRVCSDRLSLNLTVANAMKVLLLADVFREDSLKRKALDFISQNRPAFTDPSKFDSSVKQRPDLLVEVINRIATL